MKHTKPKLSVVALPTVSEQNKTNILEMLQNLSTEAAQGKINSLIVITGTVDNTWRNSWAGLAEVDRVLGQLRIMEADLLNRFLHG